MLRTAKGEDFANSFGNLVQALDGLGMKEKMLPKINNNIQNKVNSSLLEKLQEMLPTKMAENGVKIECEVLPTDREADFFFDKLQTLT